MSLSIIWNLTRYCAWTCKFCCVNAICINGKIDQKTHQNTLSNSSHYRELTLQEKKQIIDQLEPDKYTIDFSGGELMVDSQNVELIKYASQKLGADAVGISVSGAFMTDEVIDNLVGKIRDVEITLDCLPFEYYSLRPVGYHESAGYAIQQLKKMGFTVGVQTVLTKENIDQQRVFQLFKWLESNNVEHHFLFRQ